MFDQKSSKRHSQLLILELYVLLHTFVAEFAAKTNLHSSKDYWLQVLQTLKDKEEHEEAVFFECETKFLYHDQVPFSTNFFSKQELNETNL